MTLYRHTWIPLALIMVVGALPQAFYLTMGFEAGVVVGLGSLASILIAHSLILSDRVEKIQSEVESNGK